MSTTITLSEFNNSEQVKEQLFRCCGCEEWVERVQACRPYSSFQALLARAAVEWLSLSPAHWREGFLAHPRIGDKEALKKKFAPGQQTPGWEEGEQSGVDAASEAVLNQLAEMNDRYDAKFGFLFLICATGKTAEQMLQAVQGRIHNSIDEELCIAAAEQGKITVLRLHKLIIDCCDESNNSAAEHCLHSKL